LYLYLHQFYKFKIGGREVLVKFRSTSTKSRSTVVLNLSNTVFLATRKSRTLELLAFDKKIHF